MEKYLHIYIVYVISVSHVFRIHDYPKFTYT